MKTITDKTYTNEEVQVDGIQFVKCVFKNCLLVYSGGTFSAIQTDFNASRWVFDGPAQNTISSLQALYHGAGAHGRSLVEGTFDNIRQNILPLRPDIKDEGELPN